MMSVGTVIWPANLAFQPVCMFPLGKMGDRLTPALPHVLPSGSKSSCVAVITGRIAGLYWLSHIPVNGAFVAPLRSHVNLYKSAALTTVLGTPGNGSLAGGSLGFSRR